MTDDIVIDVQANTEDASSSLMSLADGIMMAFGSKIVDAIGSAFTFVTDQLQEFVSMAGEAEEVGALFASTLAGSPLAAYGDELENLAQSLQKTTRFEDESILSAETVILRYNEIGHDVFPRVTATSLDLAESMKTTAEGGAQMLGRALSDIANGSLSALKRSRLLSQETIDQATAMAKAGDAAGAQTLILDALDAKIGNVAETMAGTFNGAWQKFTITMGNVKEEMGAKLLPIFTPLVQKFQTLAEKYAPMLGRVFDVVIVPAITAMVGRIIPLVDMWLPRIMDGIDALLAPGGAFVDMISGLGKAINDLFNIQFNAGALFAPLKLGLDALAVFWIEQGPAIQKIAQETFAKLAVIFGDLADKVLPWLAEKFHQLGNWFVANGPLITKFIQVLADQFVGTVNAVANMWPILQAVLDGVINQFLILGKMVMQVMTGDMAGAFETWKAGWTNTFATIGNVITAFGNWIGSFFGTTWAQTTSQWGAFFTGLVQMVQTQFTLILNSILLSMSLIVSGIYAKIIEIQTNFALGVTNWVNAIGDKLDAFQDVGTSIVGKIQSGIEGSWGSFSSWISEKIQAIIDGLLAAIGLPTGTSGTGGEMGGVNVSTTFAGAGGGAGGASPSMGSGGGVTYNFGPVTQTFRGKPNTSIYGAG